MADSGGFRHDLFIVHAPADRAWVDGYLKHAVGVDPARLTTPRDFALGASIPAEFDRATTSSRYTVLVLSPAFLADRWAAFGEELVSFTNVEQGRQRLVVLTLHPCQQPARLRALVGLDCTDWTEWDEQAAKLRGLLEHPDPTPEDVPCPYPGMAPFLPEDERFFFGREEEVQDLLTRLRAQRFLMVIGSSGSGKSSLILAGLLPRLGDRNLFPSGTWKVIGLRPGAAPSAELATRLGGDPEPSEPIITSLLANGPPAKRLLLFVDQFEELFTLVKDRDEQDRFLGRIKGLRADPRCAVLATMRADFYGDLMNSSLWPVDDAQQVKIAAPRGEALREAIVAPAEKVGVYLEDALVERLLADSADEPGQLPMLQEALVLLWGRRKQRLLTRRSYEELGGEGRNGLAVAMANRADGTLADLSDQEQRIARRIFLRLVQFGEGRPDTRRQLSVDELRSHADDPRVFDRVLATLIEHRLLTPSYDEHLGPRVDIAHEMLIIGWPASRAWVGKRREAERTRRRLEVKAQEWVRLGRGRGALLDADELPEAERWLASDDARELGDVPALGDLIRISREVLDEAERRDREQQEALIEEQRRRIEVESRAASRLRRRAYLLSAALVVVIGLAVIAAFLFHEARKEAGIAERNARLAREQTKIAERQTAIAKEKGAIALSRQLAAQAVSFQKDQLDLSYLLDLEALRTHDSAEARDSLFSGMNQSPPLLEFLNGPGAPVRSLASSGNGKAVVAGGDEGLILWDLATRHRSASIRGGEPIAATSVTIGRDGKLVAWGRPNGAITLWDLDAGRSLGDLKEGHTKRVNCVAFNGDETKLASCGDDGAVIFWDVATRQRLGEPLVRSGPVNRVNSVAFSRDGSTLASGNHDGTITLWDVAKRRPLGADLGVRGTGPVCCVAFRDDGKTLAAGRYDQTIVCWDIATRQPLGPPLTGHDTPVISLSFSRDGKVLASGGGDGAVMIWDADRRVRQAGPLVGAHNRPVTGVAFGEGTTLVSGGGDGHVVLWDTSINERLGTSLVGHKDAVFSLTSHADGKVLVSAGGDGAVMLWDFTTRPPTRTHAAQLTSRIHDADLSPDGRTLALGSEDGALTLWDVARRQPIGEPIARQEGAINGVEFSRDGKTLASCGDDGSVVLWDVATRRPVGPRLAGHVGQLWRVRFSGDGKTLAAAGDDGVILWDVATRRALGAPLHGHTRPVSSLAFSPDSSILVSGGEDGRVIFWNVSERRIIGVPGFGNQGPVSSVAFSPDGSVLATGGALGIILWEVATRERRGTPLLGHKGYVWSVAFLGNWTLAAGGETDVVLWDVDLRSWEARACRIANRNFSLEEWRKYLGPDVPYRRSCPDLPPGEGGIEADPVDHRRH